MIEWSKKSFGNNKIKINMLQTKLKAVANRNNTRDRDKENEIKNN